ncbi:hypothetical protein G4228_017962 [Cervus hanglu yarkandensis]|nr:hypothetical protein G4228_017962 [Cervus hanglu yarkandensis]
MAASLWMGDLEPYMDENFISRAFATVGETVMSVKIIRNRLTGIPAGYCFVEFADLATAEKCLHKINGKPLPGATPAKRFKLNYATYGKQPDNSPEYSLFVGDLTLDVDDGMLYEFFVKVYPSCRGGKVVLDQTGVSKGYGFVKFTDELEQKRALTECQGAIGLGSKPVRLSVAIPKASRVKPVEYSQMYSYSYNQYTMQTYEEVGDDALEGKKGLPSLCVRCECHLSGKYGSQISLEGNRRGSPMFLGHVVFYPRM